MIPDRIRSDFSAEEICTLAQKWKINHNLAFGLLRMAHTAPFPISIFSGYRTCEHQQQLKQEGATAADCDTSTHTICPAIGADVQPNITVTNVVKAELGRAAMLAGLRWGGGAPYDGNGIPIGNEWMHVDLGPRQG